MVVVDAIIIGLIIYILPSVDTRLDLLCKQRYKEFSTYLKCR